jgi:hypothetical protein
MSQATLEQNQAQQSVTIVEQSELNRALVATYTERVGEVVRVVPYKAAYATYDGGMYDQSLRTGTALVSGLKYRIEGLFNKTMQEAKSAKLFSALSEWSLANVMQFKHYALPSDVADPADITGMMVVTGIVNKRVVVTMVVIYSTGLFSLYTSSLATN